ncbi:hypothetical protein [Streptomyces caelestis]|uniref:hypothetical protein n=1 Tax=Streptomyces caelestis TaxID=36816 RepID=UPI003648CBD5
MSRGKELPPSSSGGQELTALLRSRHARTGDGDTPAPPAAPAPVQRSARAKGAAMDRWSWYVPKESADALAAALEELHFATRQPKHVVLAALVDVALEHLPAVEQRVSRQQ